MAEATIQERTLPHNLEAERSVLGAILLHNDAFNLAAEVIDSRDFYRDAHRRIFDKMVALSERNDPIDLVTLKEELQRAGELEEIGGPAYIASLADGVPRSANVEHYARIVKEKATLRSLIHSANRILDRKSTRLNSSHVKISYAVFCLKKKKKNTKNKIRNKIK